MSRSSINVELLPRGVHAGHGQAHRPSGRRSDRAVRRARCPERSDPPGDRAASLRGGELRCGAFGDTSSKTNLTYHLARLREAGILRIRCEGACRWSSLRTDELDGRFPGLLRAVLDAARLEGGSRLGDGLVARDLGGRGGVAGISAEASWLLRCVSGRQARDLSASPSPRSRGEGGPKGRMRGLRTPHKRL